MVAYGGNWAAQGAPRPQSGKPAMPVKKELGTKPQAGETDREAKIRAKMEQIRAAAKNPSANAPVIAPTQGANKKTAAPVDPARESADAQKLEKLLPPLEEKISALEEEVERVAIVAAPLNMEATPELRDLQNTAVRETERVTKVALTNVGSMRKELERRQKEVTSFAPVAQESATQELSKLLGKLDAVQQRLDEFKSVRKDFDVAIAAEKLFGELAARLASIEMDCEKCAMMAEPLQKASEVSSLEVSPAGVKEAKHAVSVASAMLAPMTRMIAGKVPSLKGAMRNKMLELQVRAETAQKMIDKAQGIVDDATSRASAGPILQKAQDYLQKVEEMIAAMRETEGPFLMGIETLPGDEGFEVIAKMDDAATLAQTAITEAQEFMSAQFDEAARFTDIVAEAIRTQLRVVKESLSSSMSKVRTFQGEVGNRKRANLVESVRVSVQEAETAAEQIAVASESLQAASGDDILDALEKGKAIEQQLQNAIGACRKHLQEKLPNMKTGAKADPKHSADMQKAKSRVHALDAELTKFRKQMKDVEEKLSVDKSLSEVLEIIKNAEAEVEQISEMSEAWPADAKIAEEDEAMLKKVQGKVSAATSQVEKKIQAAQGLELKELRAIFNRLKAAQDKLNRVKGKAGKAARAEGTKELSTVSEIVQTAEGKLRELGGSNSGNIPLAKLEVLEQTTSSLLALVAQAQSRLEEMQKQGIAPEVKVDFARLQVRCKGVVSRAKLAASNFNSKFDQASNMCVGQLVSAFRSIAKQADGTYDIDALWIGVAGGAAELSAEMCVNHFLARMPEVDEEKVRFAFRRIAPYGLSKPGLASILAQFVKVIRGLTITDDFSIASAKKLRTLEIGEVLEVISEEKDDTGLRLKRVQCRCTRDGLVGWTTMKSASGEVYLESASKPMLWLPQGAPLASAPEQSSGVIRELLPEEVVELVEGPREEKFGSDKRVRGMACAQNANGWLQVEDKDGKILAKLDKNIHKCAEAIAMTDVSDFENCTMLRKIEAGEALEALPEEVVKPAEGGSRGMFRTCKDGAVGWVTIKGSQGTQYLRPVPKHYVCVHATPLHTGLGADSAVSSVLMPGEAFAAFEDPKNVSGDPTKVLYKVRATKDGIVGWVASTPENKVQPWSKRYTVQAPVSMTTTLAANEAAENVEVVRTLQANESVEAIEPPIEDRTTGQLRLRCTALSDKVVGWATVRDGSSSSALIMMTVSPEKAAAPAAKGKGGQGKGGVKRPLVAVKQEVEEPRKNRRL